MKKYLFRFKVIDHYSDICSPTEQTIIESDNKEKALMAFFYDMMGECIDLISVTEWEY